MNKKELETEIKELNVEVEKEYKKMNKHEDAIDKLNARKRELKKKLYNECVKDIKVGDYIIYESFEGDKIEYGKVLKIDPERYLLTTQEVSEVSYFLTDWDFFIRKATNQEMIDRLDGKIIKK